MVNKRIWIYLKQPIYLLYKRTTFMKANCFQLLLAVAIFMSGCDIARPKKNFRLVIPEKDYFYNYISSHLKPFLDSKGYKISIIEAENSIEANRLVATGEADLAIINNNSVPLSEKLGVQSGRLRTVLPLSTRLFFAFSKNLMPDTATIKELFENRKVGIEVSNMEAKLNFESFLSRAKIVGTQLVDMNEDPEVIIFWGTFYGERATKFLKEGWHPYSFKPNAIEFLTLNDPALRPYTLPSIPGDGSSIRINTISTETVLVANQDIGENSIYELSEVIFQNRLELIHKDIMYQSIDESFNQQALLFPLHSGTTSYLQREKPTFFERYSDTIALVLSILAILYGILQTIGNHLAKRRKEQLNRYFLDFLEIRSDKELDTDLKIEKLDKLFQRAVVIMTNKKLDKSDFHILSRLIQQEIIVMKVNA